MKNEMDHGITGLTIPSYIEDILTHNYCPYFMKMTIIRENDNYRFIYRPQNLRKLRTEDLDIYSKMVLLRSLIEICDKTDAYLIKADNYLLEPELIYLSGERFNEDNLRIMYYPDSKKLSKARKIMLFAERIKGSNREEREFFEQFRKMIENGDVNRAALFLEKSILRYENRMISKAS